MNYWYRFKIKGIYDLDVNVAKNEEEAENKAYMAVLNLFKGVPLFEVLECEIDESAEVE
jgi:hypothetical protein